MLSKLEMLSVVLTQYDQEGFMLAYHVRMDDGTKMIGAQFKTFF